MRDPIIFSHAVALEKISPAPPEADNILRSYGYALNRTMVNEDEPNHMIRRLTRESIDRFIAQGNILHLKLSDPQGKPLPDWTAGSHIDLFSKGITRKYSLCGAADEAGTFRVFILREEAGRGGL